MPALGQGGSKSPGRQTFLGHSVAPTYPARTYQIHIGGLAGFEDCLAELGNFFLWLSPG